MEINGFDGLEPWKFKDSRIRKLRNQKAASMSNDDQNNEANQQTDQTKVGEIKADGEHNEIKTNAECNEIKTDAECNETKADDCRIICYQSLPLNNKGSRKCSLNCFPLCKIYEDYKGKLEELKIIKGSMELIDFNEEEQREMSSINGTMQVYAIIPKENEKDILDETQETSNLNNDYEALNQEIMSLSQETIPSSQETISDDTDLECNWIVEKAKPQTQEQPILEGIDFVDFKYVFNQLLTLDDHSNIGCSIRHFKIIGRYRNGLKITYSVKCEMCNQIIHIPCIQQNNDVIDINESAVSATMVLGGGYVQLMEMLACLNVSCMSKQSYDKHRTKIIEAFELAAQWEMEAAGKKERELAIARGDVCPDSGIPWIPVVADGSWMKRSYKGGYYNSPSGVGVIVGYYTKKVLYVGVKNKVCITCRVAAKKKEKPSEHRCFKNWGTTQSSTAMESVAILEGFECSIKMHGLIYSILIADGDSSVYKKILDRDPYKQYSVRVQKIECINHMLRNFGKKIANIGTTGGCQKLRAVVKKNALRLRACIRKAAQYRYNENLPLVEKLERLKADLTNVPSHVFGEHKDCERLAYFCNQYSAPNVINYVPQLKEAGIYKRIEEAMQPLFKNIQSLLYCMNNNAAEVFNAIIAKYIGGKRINFGLKGSYQGRVYAAVVQYNTKEAVSRMCRAINKEPPVLVRKIEERRKSENRRYYISSRRRKRQMCDKDYGPCAEQPEIEEIVFTPEYEKKIAALHKC
nr:PREDICTED: uncharacterized protein LOC105663106 isoform X2 [Megachile rotundata]